MVYGDLDNVSAWIGDLITAGAVDIVPGETYTLALNGNTLTLTDSQGEVQSVELPAGFSGRYDDLTGKPALFSGDYDDLTDKPTLFSGSYNDLTNKPTIPAIPARAGAFTAADETKLDGIQEGAQKNPDHVVSFRSLDNDGAIDGTVFFIKADNTQWNSGSTDDIAAVEIDSTQFDLTQNPQTATAGYSNWHSLPQDLVDNMGSSIWNFYNMGSGVTLPTEPTFQLQAETVAKNSEGNYVLQHIHVLKGWTWSGSNGVNWQVSGVFAPPSGADSIIGVIGSESLPPYPQAATQTPDAITYGQAGAIGTATSYAREDHAHAMATLPTEPFTDALEAKLDALQFPVKFTRDFVASNTSAENEAATSTNNTETFGTTDFLILDKDDEVDYINSIVVGDWIRLTVGAKVLISEVVGVEDESDNDDVRVIWYRVPLPYSTGLDQYRQIGTGEGTIEVSRVNAIELDANNITPTAIAMIQGDNEESTLDNTFRVDVTNVDYYVSLNEPGGGNLNTATIRLPSSSAGTEDDNDLKRLLKTRAWVEVADYKIDVTTNATRSIVGTSLTYAFNYIVVSGTKPTGSTPVSVRVVGEDVHRGELSRQAFESEDPSIAGKGGVEGQVWTRDSNNKNAQWQDIPKASTSEVNSGTSDAKFVTPKGLGEAYSIAKDYTDLLYKHQWLNPGNSSTDATIIEETPITRIQDTGDCQNFELVLRSPSWSENPTTDRYGVEFIQDYDRWFMTYNHLYKYSNSASAFVVTVYGDEEVYSKISIFEVFDKKFVVSQAGNTDGIFSPSFTPAELNNNYFAFTEADNHSIVGLCLSDTANSKFIYFTTLTFHPITRKQILDELGVSYWKSTFLPDEGGTWVEVYTNANDDDIIEITGWVQADSTGSIRSINGYTSRHGDIPQENVWTQDSPPSGKRTQFKRGAGSNSHQLLASKAGNPHAYMLVVRRTIVE